MLFFYQLLAKSERIKKWLDKLANSKYKYRIEKQGPLVVVLLTPIIGSWAVAVIANGIGMNKLKLFISAGASILIYGIIIAVLTYYGVEFIADVRCIKNINPHILQRVNLRNMWIYLLQDEVSINKLLINFFEI